MVPRRVAAVLVAALVVVTGSAASQLHPVYPGDFLLADPGANAVFHVSNGSVNTFTTMNGVTHVTTDGMGNLAYLAGSNIFWGDSYGKITTLYSGAPLNNPVDAYFHYPQNSSAQYELFVLDYGAAAIFSVDSTGILRTVHQGSPLQYPTAFTLDRNNAIWIVDDGANAVFRMNYGGVFNTFATGLDIPSDIQKDDFGNILVTDEGTARAIYLFNEFGQRSTIVQGSPFTDPSGVWVGRDGYYYVSDSTAQAVYRISPSGSWSTFATYPGFSSPGHLFQAPVQDQTYAILDRNSNSMYYVYNSGCFCTLYSGSPWSGTSPDNLIRNHNGDYVVAADNAVYNVTPNGNLTTVYNGSPLTDVTDIALDLNGDYLVCSSTGSIWRLSPGSGSSYTANTFFTGGLLSSAQAIEVGPFGQVYVADPNRNAIWKISADGTTLNTYYMGSPLSNPNGLVWGDQNWLYVTDSNRSAVYRINRNQQIEEYFSGNPLISPTGIHTDFNGNFLVSDDGAKAIFSFDHYKNLSTFLYAPSYFNGVRGISASRYVWQQGDFVVADSGNDGEIWRFNYYGFPNAIAYPEDYFQASNHATCVISDRFNFDFVATLSGVTSGLARITPNGMVPLYWGNPLTTPTWVTIDDYGNYLVTQSGTTDALFRINNQGQLYTVYSGSPLANPQCVTIDNDTGDYVVLDYGAGALFRISYNGTLNTIATGIFAGTCVVHNQWDGNFYLSASTGHLYRVTPAGGIATLYSGGVLDLPNSIYITPDHQLYVTDAGPGPNGIYQFDFNGNLIETLHQTGAENLIPTSVTWAWGRPLSNWGTGQIGSDYQLFINLPSEANLNYTLGAAFTTRPVLTFQGRGWSFFPDVLTNLSLAAPTIFENFTSQFLDNYGRGHATIHIPNSPSLVGLRLHVSGFTSKAGYGDHNIHEFFNTIGVTIR